MRFNKEDIAIILQTGLFFAELIVATGLVIILLG